MNNKIKKLMKKANLSPYYDQQEKDIENFVELIVRECAKIADDGYGSDHFGNGISGYQLLQHFGIE